MRIYDPYIVVGTGRCGSSFVSGVLHNDLDICMGKEMRGPGPYNVDGYYEDIHFKKYNEMILVGDLTLQGWLKLIQQTIVERRNLGKKWGFKDPRISELLGLYLTFFDKPRIIWCDRDKDLVINSLVKNYEYPVERAEMQYNARNMILNRLIPKTDHVKIYFNGEKVSKDTVIDIVTSKWQN